MSDLVPRRNDLMKRDDFFSPFFRNFFDDDFFYAMDYMHGDFRVDLKETDDNFLVEAELPGINKEAIDVDFENNHLTISARRNEEVEENKENFIRRERNYGEFKRSFYINNVDEDSIDASFNDGILRITLAKLNKGIEKKKKINIH
jgi:HSP20 family protein